MLFITKEVLQQAINNTMGFPDGIKIPTTSGVCPGFAQGKMPATLHPPSVTRATETFKQIHSDLKSFPIPSYHKYKYFIVFLDDYTSHVWVTLLHDKASAITALKQWLALIKINLALQYKSGCLMPVENTSQMLL